MAPDHVQQRAVAVVGVPVHGVRRIDQRPVDARPLHRRESAVGVVDRHPLVVPPAKAHVGVEDGYRRLEVEVYVSHTDFTYTPERRRVYQREPSESTPAQTP